MGSWGFSRRTSSGRARDQTHPQTPLNKESRYFLSLLNNLRVRRVTAGEKTGKHILTGIQEPQPGVDRSGIPT